MEGPCLILAGRNVFAGAAEAGRQPPELRHRDIGYQEPLGQPGEEQGDGQAIGGDLVGAAVRDAFD